MNQTKNYRILHSDEKRDVFGYLRLTSDFQDSSGSCSIIGVEKRENISLFSLLINQKPTPLLILLLLL